ncbi:hypothetical protein AB0J80_32205 [Actinoplanes sp. NPDC049548]|uniref:hypothetical protein n=1 Tax=Actinoplanes sp. NPDC049548 TaxID=3155152 RepID=UPI00341F6DFB
MDPVQGVLGEPPAPPPEVWAAVLARALDPQAPPIDAAGLLPEYDSGAEWASDETDLIDDDTDGWSHPHGQLTEVVPDHHDDAHDHAPPEEPWSSGPEPEMS